MLSTICFNLDQSKILSFGNGLTKSPKGHSGQDYLVNGIKWNKISLTSIP